MKLFLDADLPPRAARALAALYGPEGQEVVHFRDRFPAGTADEEWLPALTEEGGWVVLTRDRKIGRNPKQRELWRRAGLPVFFLDRSWGQHRGLDQCRQLIQRWPDVVALAEESKGTGFLVGYRGKIEPLVHYPKRSE